MPDNSRFYHDVNSRRATSNAECVNIQMISVTQWLGQKSLFITFPFLDKKTGSSLSLTA